MAKAKQAVAKSASVEKNLTLAMEKLAEACNEGNDAVAERGKLGKKLLAEVRKLTKRNATLTRRKKTAAKKAKTDGSAASRKALRNAVKELADNTKALTKLRAERGTNLGELNALTALQRQASAYQKAVANAEKALNKPKKRRRRRVKQAAEE